MKYFFDERHDQSLVKIVVKKAEENEKIREYSPRHVSDTTEFIDWMYIDVHGSIDGLNGWLQVR